MTTQWLQVMKRRVLGKLHLWHVEIMPFCCHGLLLVDVRGCCCSSYNEIVCSSFTLTDAQVRNHLYWWATFHTAQNNCWNMFLRWALPLLFCAWVLSINSIIVLFKVQPHHRNGLRALLGKDINTLIKPSKWSQTFLDNNINTQYINKDIEMVS